MQTPAPVLSSVSLRRGLRVYPALRVAYGEVPAFAPVAAGAAVARFAALPGCVASAIAGRSRGAAAVGASPRPQSRSHTSRLNE
jgi:hypothetical protein